jgi:hypothetical protein
MACDAETLKDVSWALVICNCVSSSTIGWKPISGKVSAVYISTSSPVLGQSLGLNIRHTVICQNAAWSFS